MNELSQRDWVLIAAIAFFVLRGLTRFVIKSLKVLNMPISEAEKHEPVFRAVGLTALAFVGIFVLLALLMPVLFWLGVQANNLVGVPFGRMLEQWWRYWGALR